MNRELFKICIFAGKRRGECYATFSVRRAHVALLAAFLSIAGALAFSESVGAATRQTLSAIDLFSGAAKNLAVSTINQSFESIGNGVDRIHRYEQELKLRADSLETVLKDLKSLEGVDLLETEPVLATPKIGRDLNTAEARNSKKLGVGGGIDRRTPVITGLSGQPRSDSTNPSPRSELGAKKPAAARIPADKVIDELDFLLERIRQIPIGTPTDGEVSSEFGYRRSPFSVRGSQLHSGIDISTEIRSSVIATADGRVVSTGYKSNYGQTVIIDHGDGFETLYGHLSKITVQPGDKVCRGEEIGLVGMTGRSTGPHVHYEIRVDGVARNPRSFIELADLLKLI